MSGRFLGTYQLVSDDTEMRRRTATADEFLEQLRDWHRLILGDRARRWTSRTDWSSLEVARGRLDRSNAFVDANDAEERGLQLLDPVGAEPTVASR